MEGIARVPNLTPRDGDKCYGCAHSPGAPGNKFFAVGEDVLFLDRNSLDAVETPKWLVICAACFQAYGGDFKKVPIKKAFTLEGDHPLDPEVIQ